MTSARTGPAARVYPAVTASVAVMKPRRENGATFVSPMTSDVCMGSALMIIPQARVVVQKFPLSVRQLRPGELPEQNRAGIMDFQGFLEAESRAESGRRRTLGESRIQQAIAAERKSPACEDAAGITAACLGGGRGCGGQERNKAVGAVYR